MLAAALFACTIAPTFNTTHSGKGDSAGRVRIELSKFLSAYQGPIVSDAGA